VGGKAENLKIRYYEGSETFWRDFLNINKFTRANEIMDFTNYQIFQTEWYTGCCCGFLAHSSTRVGKRFEKVSTIFVIFLS